MSFSEEAKASFRVAFDMIDTNGDGCICVSELKNLVEKTGAVLTDEEVQEMLNESDYDADGKISFDEFITMWSKKMGC